MEIEKLVLVIESVLFALGREISYVELSNVLQIEEENILKAVEKLKQRYSKDYGVNLVSVGDKIQMVTNNENYEYVNKFVENSKKKTLSNTVLETLSIIAYNPKITKTEIESIRGVNSDFAVSRLLEIGLVEEVERLNLPGRPAAYSVTSEFLKSCNIQDLSELPNFDDISVQEEVEESISEQSTEDNIEN